MSKTEMFVFCLLFVGTVTSQGLIADPCDADNHRAFSDARLGSRNEVCEVGPDLALCDYYIRQDWYVEERSVLLNRCPKIGSCGVNYPGWMNGTFPRHADGVVNRTVCIKENNNCCADQVPIQIKNCTSFLVYHLPRMPECDHVYCFESNYSCDEPKPTTTTTESSIVTPIPPENTKYIFIGVAVGVGLMVSIAAVVTVVIVKTGICKRTSRIEDQSKAGRSFPDNPPPYDQVVQPEIRKH